MTKYRDKLQIVADILTIVRDGAKKTRIMYQANLSYKLLCRYLDEASEARLIAFNDEALYVLTAKGEAFLSRFERYSEVRKNLEAQMDVINREKRTLKQMCGNDASVNDDVASRG